MKTQAYYLKAAASCMQDAHDLALLGWLNAAQARKEDARAYLARARRAA